jgi:hypothetical protein
MGRTQRTERVLELKSREDEGSRVKAVERSPAATALETLIGGRNRTPAAREKAKIA